MQELIIGTSNPAKIQMIRSVLKQSGIRVKSTKEMGISMEIHEDGATAQENARKKSTIYAAALGKPVLSIDIALYFDGLTADQQPGSNARRLVSQLGRATDEEILKYYTQIISSLGGNVSGRWEFALCFADHHGKVFETTIISPRQFVDFPSKQMILGYPLESIQIDESRGKYMSELTPEEKDAFWQEQIGHEVNEFIKCGLQMLVV